MTYLSKIFQYLSELNIKLSGLYENIMYTEKVDGLWENIQLWKSVDKMIHSGV